MMTREEKEKFLRAIGMAMEEYEGRVTGTMDLVFPNSALDGTDERVHLTFPNWERIGSIPSSQR
jgi:hypothetical protein